MEKLNLDELHTELQGRLKEVNSIRDLVPYLEKTVPLESLKIQISDALVNALKKEKKVDGDTQQQQEAHEALIKPLYDIITAPPQPDIDEDDEAMMQPRKVDDDAKSNHNNNGVQPPSSRQPQDQRQRRPSDDDSDSLHNYPRRPFNRGGPPRHQPQQRYGRGPPEWSTSICYNCNQKGHFARECPSKFRGGFGGGGGRGGRGGGGGGGNVDDIVCYHCGKDGHFARDCPEESNDELNDKCFRCGKIGHWARDCDLKKPVMNRFANDKCNRCGKVGHWARDCDLPYQPPNFGGSGINKSNDKCNRCGKIGHWARDCDLPRNDGYGIQDDDF